MKSITGPVETKVAAACGAGAIVSLLFGLAAQYHWFTPPSPYLTALTVTAVSAFAAWWAPHTPRSLPTATISTHTSPAVVAGSYSDVRRNEPYPEATGAGSAVVVQPSASVKP